MKKILAIVAAFALTVSGYVWGETLANNTTAYYASDTYYMTNNAASFAVSNLYAYAYKVGSVTFTLPASSTDTFTMKRVRCVHKDTYRGNVVTTNWWGTVETNYSFAVTSVSRAAITNQFFTTNTVNVTDQVYDLKKIPEVYIAPGDAIIYGFTSGKTNFYMTVDLLR